MVLGRSSTQAFIPFFEKYQFYGTFVRSSGSHMGSFYKTACVAVECLPELPEEAPVLDALEQQAAVFFTVAIPSVE